MSHCAVGIDLSQSAGAVIGNTVSTSSGQVGMVLPTSTSSPTLVDQNAVPGSGVHYNGGSSATVYGYNN